jgi:hypothetical protein
MRAVLKAKKRFPLNFFIILSNSVKNSKIIVDKIFKLSYRYDQHKLAGLIGGHPITP